MSEDSCELKTATGRHVNKWVILMSGFAHVCSWQDDTDFYLELGQYREFVQDTSHPATPERCRYHGQQYLSVVAAHQCLKTANPETGEAGQEQRHFFRDRNSTFYLQLGRIWTRLCGCRVVTCPQTTPHTHPCSDPTPSLQRRLERVEMPPPTKKNV